MKKIILLSILVALGLSANENGATLYKSCSACHGLNGEKKALNVSLIIKDMTREDISISLNGYKNGTYGGKMKGLMVSQVSKLAEPDLEDLSIYIASLNH